MNGFRINFLLRDSATQEVSKKDWFACPPEPCCYGEICHVINCCKRPNACHCVPPIRGSSGINEHYLPSCPSMWQSLQIRDVNSNLSLTYPFKMQKKRANIFYTAYFSFLWGKT